MSICLSSDSDSEDERGRDLNDDLYEALSGEFEFTGNYYHHSVEVDAPDPGVTIEGIGMVNLPLTEHDARKIISRSAQAPFGKGKDTIVDTAVRDTWEIEPAKVSFANSEWNKFVQRVAIKSVSSSLGVAPYTKRPRCELHKLLLYQTGSHFAPHQDTAKAHGMFATVVVVLPSPFQGGEVHVSHGRRTTILDASKASKSSTSILAWYTDVFHEIKPIISGYRLALSYNLIHTAPNIPKPSLTNLPTGPLEKLRKTLERWKKGNYESIPDPPLFAYLLSHQYSQVDLYRGLEALKGKDAHLIAHILPLVNELGFTLCLAHLKKTELGSPDPSDLREYYKRSRYEFYYESDEESEDPEVPAIYDIREETLEISNIVRIGTNGVKHFGLWTFELNFSSLVPSNAFDDCDPDDSRYEGYQGNHGGDVEQWYNASALVLLRKDEEISIKVSIKGAAEVLRTLKVTGKPPPGAQDVVNTVLATLSDSSAAALILKHAIAWKQPQTWNKAIPFITEAEAIEGALADALEIFELYLIKPGLSALIQKQSMLQNRLDLIDVVADHLPEDRDSPWIQKLIRKSLSSYSAASLGDVPALIQLAQDLDGGFTTLASTVIPRTQNIPNTYEFHMNLTKALDHHRTRAPHLTTEEAEELIDLVMQCLSAAVSQWAATPPDTPYPYSQNNSLSPTILAERINDLVKIFLSIGHAEMCVGLFSRVGVDRQMDILTAIKANIGDASTSWVRPLMKTVISRYSTPAVSHVPILSWIAQEIGPRHIHDLVRCRILIGGTYEFFISLAKSLQERSLRLRRAQKMTDQLEDAYREAIVRCITSAIPFWESGIHCSPYPSAPSTAILNRIIEIVESCFMVSNLNPCTDLMTTLQIFPCSMPDDFNARFNEIHIPLIPLLKSTLLKHEVSITHSPFKTYFKTIISTYFAHVLGSTRPVSPPELPRHPIGCSDRCAQCVDLDAWIRNSSQQIQFSYALPIRKHIQQQLIQVDSAIRHIVAGYDTIKSGCPHTLVVEKRSEVLKGLEWKDAQRAAKRFIRSIGSDAEIKEVMGERYKDVLRALSGKERFITGRASFTPITTSAGSSSTRSTGLAPAAGGKRSRKDR